MTENDVHRKAYYDPCHLVSDNVEECLEVGHKYLGQMTHIVLDHEIWLPVAEAVSRRFITAEMYDTH